jgi:hypothetical protein
MNPFTKIQNLKIKNQLKSSEVIIISSDSGSDDGMYSFQYISDSN